MNHLVILAGFIGICFAGWLALWVMFLAVMQLKSVKDAGLLTPDMPAYKIGMVVLFIGYFVDMVVNLTAATVLFLEIPDELTVTKRCSRLLVDNGFRGAIARWLCRNLLDPFQIGGHCH